MLKRIQELLAPPVFEDEKQTRRASLLNVMLLASILINVVSGLLAIFIEGASRVQLLSTSAGLLLQLIVMVFLRRRRIRFASLLLCLGFWLAVTFFSFVSGGISSPLLSFYGVLVLGAGLLSGSRVGAGFAGLSIASTVTMYYFREQAVLARFSALTPASLLLNQITFLISIVVVLYLASRSLGNTLERARSQIRANRELTTLRTSLEDRVADLERAEKSLRDSETLYHALVENLPHSVYYQDKEGKVIFANRRYCEGYGKPLEEIVGKTAFDLHPPEMAEQYRLDDRQVMERGEILEKEEEHQVPDGEKYYVQVVKIPMYDSSGQVVGIQGIFWDITERKRVESILRQSHLELKKLVEARTAELEKERNLLHTLVEALPDYIYIKDAESRFIITNIANARVLGVESVEQTLGKTDLDFYPKHEAVQYYADEQSLMRSGQPLLNKEEVAVDKTGKKRWTLTTKVPIRDGNGQVIGIAGMGRDITERKQIEDALRESEERFRKLFEASPDAVMLIDANDPHWPIVDCNQVACQMNGYTREELIGQSLDLLYASATDPAERAAYLDRLQREGIVQIETCHRHKNGTLFQIEASTTLITVRDKELVLDIDRDITERKQSEETLRQLSTHDGLTGLYNRAFFEGELTRLEASRLFPVSIVVTDVDALKTTNDREGHAAGDELLRRTAAVLGAAFRAEDIIARIGGDEFAVLLPQTTAEAVRLAMDRCRMEINRQNDIPGKPRLSLSIGAATAQKSDHLTQTLQLADENMYQDKVARKDPSGER